MGVVYLAYDTSLRREVALKMITRRDVDESALARFRRECHALAGIGRNGVPMLFDCGIAESGTPYFTMEIVRGQSLRALLTHGPLAPPRALAVALELAQILTTVHAVGLVHRDVKPDNVIIDPGDRVRLIDFGACCPLTRFYQRPHLGEVTSSERRWATGEVGWIGSPGYSAPEALHDGYAPDVRSDVYSVCVIFYEMLTGRRYPVADPIVTGELPPASGPWMADIRRGTSSDPFNRHRDMSALVRNLQIHTSTLRAPSRPTPRPWPLLVNVALATSVVAFVHERTRLPDAGPSEPRPAPVVCAEPPAAPPAPPTASLAAALDQVTPAMIAYARDRPIVLELTTAANVAKFDAVDVVSEEPGTDECVRQILGGLKFEPTATAVTLTRSLP